MSELEQLTLIINTILGNDNQARSEGEALLKKLRENDFNQYIYLFTTLLNSSPAKVARIFCVVHLRRLLSDYVEGAHSSEWYRLNNETHRYVKQTLLEVLQKEEDGPTRRVLCDLIGELFATIKKLDDEKKEAVQEEGKNWDLMPNIWGFLTSGNTILMESALKILGILFVYCGKEFAEHTQELFPILKQALEHENIRVKAGAIDAIANFIATMQTKYCKVFKDLIPLMLQSIILIVRDNEELGVDVLNQINDMVGAEPKIFSNNFKDFLDTMRAVSQMNVSVDSIKSNALEIIVLTFEMLPSLTKNNSIVIKEFFEACFAYMISCVEDVDQEWISPPEGFIETSDDSNPHDAAIKYAIHLIDRVIFKLGEKICLPLFSGLLLEMVKANDWRYRYAALMGLSQVGEYIKDPTELDHIVSFTMNFFKDEHPKVRFATMHCIGQFAEDSKPEFQIRYTDKLMPSLIEMTKDETPRVVSHAFGALTNFLDGCEKGSVSNYIPQVLEPCLLYLDKSISLVKEGALSTIATLAEATQKDFIPYWAHTSEILFNILRDSSDKTYKQIRGQAIESLVLIGESVGKEEFKKGAHQIIEKLVEIQKNYIDEVDPQKMYLLSGWQRICLVLQEDFEPYLNEILPSLFDLVEQIIHIQKSRQNANKTNDTTEVISALKGSSDRQGFNKANTSESQEIVLAVKMINVFVMEQKKGFGGYVERTSNILTHLLQKSINVSVMTTAARGLPGLIKVIQETQTTNKAAMVRAMANNYIEILWNVIDDEVDPENRTVYVMVMREVLKAAGTFMNQNEINAFGDNIFKALKDSDEIKVSNEELLEDEENDVDENEEEAIKEENALEEEYHCALAELTGAVFELHREGSAQIVQIVCKNILPNVMVPNMSPKIYKFGLYFIDNLIEYIGMDIMGNQWTSLGEAVIKFVVHKKAEVRHPAAYGIGLFAQYTTQGFQGVAEVAVKALINAIQLQRGEGEDAVIYGLAKDNMVASLGKIIKYQHQCINPKELTPIWFKLLPLRYDKAEAKGQHDMLMDIILQSDASLIFGESGEYLAMAIRLFAVLVNTRFVNPDFKEKLQKVIEGLASNPDTKVVLQQAIEKLDNNLKERLKIVLG